MPKSAKHFTRGLLASAKKDSVHFFSRLCSQLFIICYDALLCKEATIRQFCLSVKLSYIRVL